MNSPSSDPIVALDVGGTSVKSGLITQDGQILQKRQSPIDSAGSSATIIHALASAITDLMVGQRAVLDIAIAFPAPFDYAQGIPLLDHKFAAIHGANLIGELRTATGQSTARIRFVNDAAAAGAGEVRSLGGSARRVLVLTLGTGLGASFFDSGVHVPARAGMVIGDLWARQVEDGSLADANFSATGLAAALGVAPAELPTAIPDGGDALDRWATRLADFLNPVIGTLEADLLIIGGGASAGMPWFANAVEQRLVVPAEQAALGSGGPLIGAAQLAFGRG